MCGRKLAVLLALAFPTVARAQSECPRGTLPAYSHNDYENARPLTDALTLGFVGAEADVFLVDGVLRVGHDRKAARTGGTLEALYLAPLQALVARCTRLTAAGRPFFLAVELKEESAAAHDSLLALFGRYRRLLEDSSAASASSRRPSPWSSLGGNRARRLDRTRWTRCSAGSIA